MKIFSSFLLLLFSLLWVSCGKDSDPKPTEPNKTDNIAASTWVYESSFIDGNGNGNLDAGEPTLESLGIPACRLDNTLTFKKDGTATADEGATKCDAADPQTSSFNWSFADNESNLVVSNYVFTALNGKFKIQTLNSTNLTVAKDTTIVVVPATIVLKMKH